MCGVSCGETESMKINVDTRHGKYPTSRKFKMQIFLNKNAVEIVGN